MTTRQNFTLGCGSESYIVKDFTTLNDHEQRCVLSYRNHPDVRKWMINSDEIGEEEHFSFLEGLESDETRRYWLVVWNGPVGMVLGETHFGVIYLTDIDYEKGVAKLGVYSNLGNAQKGKGDMLMYILQVMAFHQMKLKKLGLQVYDDNEKAIRFYQKHGFKEIIETGEPKHELISMELKHGSE